MDDLSWLKRFSEKFLFKISIVLLSFWLADIHSESRSSICVGIVSVSKLIQHLKFLCVRYLE